MAETLYELLPPHLQVADFLGQLLDEVVGPDVVRDLAGGLAHLQGLTHTSVQAGGMKRGREKEKRRRESQLLHLHSHLSLQPGPQCTD